MGQKKRSTKPRNKLWPTKDKTMENKWEIQPYTPERKTTKTRGDLIIRGGEYRNSGENKSRPNRTESKSHPKENHEEVSPKNPPENTTQEENENKITIELSETEKRGEETEQGRKRMMPKKYDDYWLGSTTQQHTKYDESSEEERETMDFRLKHEIKRRGIQNYLSSVRQLSDEETDVEIIQERKNILMVEMEYIFERLLKKGRDKIRRQNSSSDEEDSDH